MHLAGLVNLRIAALSAEDLAFLHEFVEVRLQRTCRHGMERFGDIVIDEWEQGLERRALPGFSEPIAYFLFPGEPMLYESLYFGVRAAYQIAMSGRENVEIEGAQSPQGLQVGTHIPIRRPDHHGRALHDVIAGEEHACLG